MIELSEHSARPRATIADVANDNIRFHTASVVASVAQSRAIDAVASVATQGGVP